MTAVTEHDIVSMARGMRDLVQAEAAASERNRTLTAPVVDEMWSSGLMASFNPTAAGGREPSFAEMIETWIEMAWQDGSFGWIGIANLPSSFAAAAYLSDEGFAEVFTAHDNRVTMGGQFFPNGQGAAVEGGFRLTGSWSFGSGTGHSEYVAAGFMPTDDGQPRWVAEGIPDMRVAVIPRADVAFKDGWHVQGLKGTGSYDYAVDDVADLAATKFRMSDMASLASRPTFQKGLAHHLSAWRAARLLVLDAFTAAEAAVAAGEGLTPTLRADMRAAAVYATDVARAATEWAHLSAGTSAIREGTRLERAFRDMYTGTQHAFISEKIAMDAAQIWLGLIDDQFGL